MSGSVSPGSGNAIAVVAAFVLLLLIEYPVVVVLLARYDTHSLVFKLIIGSATPFVIGLFWIISSVTKNKLYLVLSFFISFMLNSAYLLAPVGEKIVLSFYNGSNKILSILLVGFISLSLTLLFTVGLFFGLLGLVEVIGKFKNKK